MSVNTALLCGLQVGCRAAVELPLSPEASDFIGVGKRSHVQGEDPERQGACSAALTSPPGPGL